MGSGAFSLYNLHYAETQDKKGESTCCGLPLEARQHDKSPSTRYDLQQAFLVVYLHIITQHGLFFFSYPLLREELHEAVLFVCILTLPAVFLMHMLEEKNVHFVLVRVMLVCSLFVTTWRLMHN